MKGRVDLDILDRIIINLKMTILRVYDKMLLNVYCKYLERVHMADIHLQACASSPYELFCKYFTIYT